MLQLNSGFLPRSRLRQPPSVTKSAPFRSGSVIGAGENFRADLLSVTRDLRAFALTLLGDSGRTDDLVQETLLRALEKWDSFEPGTNLQAWAFTILRNLFNSEYHKRKRGVEDMDGLFAA